MTNFDVQMPALRPAAQQNVSYFKQPELTDLYRGITECYDIQLIDLHVSTTVVLKCRSIN